MVFASLYGGWKRREWDKKEIWSTQVNTSKQSGFDLIDTETIFSIIMELMVLRDLRCL